MNILGDVTLTPSDDLPELPPQLPPPRSLRERLRSDSRTTPATVTGQDIKDANDRFYAMLQSVFDEAIHPRQAHPQQREVRSGGPAHAGERPLLATLKRT